MLMDSEKPKYVADFLKVVEEKKGKVALFSHNCPDPDAIGSMMAMQWLFQKLGLESVCFYGGSISHPQNMSMFNLLDLDTTFFAASEYEKHGEFNMHVLVDTVPANAGIADNKIKFDIVIDHHKEVPNGGFNGLFINIKAGSCCGTIYNLIEHLGLAFDDSNDQDCKVATGVMVGVSTDTENLMSDDSTNYEFAAWSKLFDFRNPGILKNIINFERPKLWVDAKADAVKRTKTEDAIGLVGLGVLPEKHRDLLADMADYIVTWEGVDTAVTFAVIDGVRIEGSIRSRNASLMIPQLCKDLGGKHGSGGGKLGKGAYSFNLGGGGLSDDDDEAIRNEWWTLFNKKETARILKILKK